jgi:hypothetical protein
MWSRLSGSALGLLCMMLTGHAYAADVVLREGLYEITFRLELPHLERWSIDKATTVCVPSTTTFLPILSDNTPFATCFAKNLQRNESTVAFDIACSGRDPPKARASFVVTLDGFTARIAMTMGAKNMTMTEIQIARRLGSCPVAVAGPMPLN